MAKVLVSFEDSLLKRIDRAAKSGSTSRSAYLAGLAEDDMGRRTGSGRTAAARAALRRLDGLSDNTEAGDSTDAVRSGRDAR